MTSDEPIILSTENQNNDQANLDDPDKERRKKIIFFSLAALTVIVLIIAGLTIYKSANKKKVVNSNEPAPAATSTPAVLPDFNQPISATSTNATTSFSDLVIDYLSFADFYKAPDNNITAKFADYKLPLDVKLDILNYPDVSRKLNLDPGISNLNNNGFTLIDNPWNKEAPGFYAAYENLETRQISPLITSDFIIYYYQNIFKKVFKDIEENVFYDNLWSINKELYTAAKTRYEARLAAIGNINDSILEGERLEMAYFAVALELLKPATEQVVSPGVIDDKSKFTLAEVDRFYFSLPPYLRDDVLREEKLIREAKVKAKSPVLLYTQDYNNFVIPSEYRTDAKLSNFYLTTKWLNSVFPLNYRDKNCPTCLLDKEDWRINFIAANLISNDAANLPDLKNKWARIYKVMSFFKGLREDLNYIYYRDSLTAVFGADYDIAQLFDDQNKFAAVNLEKLKAKILTYKMSEAQGAYNQNNALQKPEVGFKMLAEPYWPNDYLFTKLIVPNVDKYLGGLAPTENITICLNGSRQRCNGIALDIINLATPIKANDYFAENINYLNYSREADKLRADLNKNIIWQTSNYWSTLSFTKAFLNINQNNQPLAAKSSAWQIKSLNTAAAAWINLQLPLEKFSVNQVFRGTGLNNNYSSWSDNAYVEPNLDLVNELLANNTMVSKMLIALQIDKEVDQALAGLNSANNNLSTLKKIIIKELQGEDLDQNDKEAIIDFAKQLKIDQTIPTNKQLTIKFPNQRINLQENLKNLKLLVLIHQVGDSKIISVGPVWNYQENR